MKIQIATDLIIILKTEYGFVDPVLTLPEDGIEGSTFFVSGGTKKQVAKVYDNSTQAEIIAQLQNSLFEARLPVPALLPTRSGSLSAHTRNYYVIVSEFARGKPIGWGKKFASLSGPFSVDLADVIAGIHITSQTIEPTSELNHSLGVTQLLKLYDNNPEFNELHHALQDCKKVLIHGDLARENIFLSSSHDSVQAIIDFGDAHYDFVTYDIAILLTQVYITKSWGVDFEGIKQFLTSYNQLNPLAHHELQTILPLMKLRNQGLMREIEQKLSGDNTDRITLESIKGSLIVKLRLLDEHGQQLEDLILNV